MIKVYGKENCGKCKELKDTLDRATIQYEYIEDQKQLMIVGSKARIMSAPIIEINNKYYSFDDFLPIVKVLII